MMLRLRNNSKCIGYSVFKNVVRHRANFVSNGNNMSRCKYRYDLRDRTSLLLHAAAGTKLTAPVTGSCNWVLNAINIQTRRPPLTMRTSLCPPAVDHSILSVVPRCSSSSQFPSTSLCRRPAATTVWIRNRKRGL